MLWLTNEDSIFFSLTHKNSMRNKQLIWFCEHCCQIMSLPFLLKSKESQFHNISL